MSEEKKKTPSVFVENMAVLTTPEGIQKYLLGTKKNGQPRAAYDVVKDVMMPKKKKKHKKKVGKPSGAFGLYVDFKENEKKFKKKKKHKKNKHWHI